MRQIILDTETTGLEHSQGHRVIEIGAVELLDRRLTGNHYHQYLNPQRDIEDGALEVHGISLEFLQDKPVFADIADEFLSFIRGAELIIHNAPFDTGFLNMELGLPGVELGVLEDFGSVLDTLELARDLHPGQRNSLDALCKRYDVDNSSRKLHGALLDAEILADVYLAMTGGQSDLGLTFTASKADQDHSLVEAYASENPLLVLRANEGELVLHRTRLDQIQSESNNCYWLELDGQQAPGQGESGTEVKTPV
jgi:DNA polymerase-3 subunit epsilon